MIFKDTEHFEKYFEQIKSILGEPVCEPQRSGKRYRAWDIITSNEIIISFRMGTDTTWLYYNGTRFERYLEIEEALDYIKQYNEDVFFKILFNLDLF